ncbi:MAG: MotA/TolQ/ExbB proton channel family protein [Myxococcota bacterium]|nr:MotA/TolQ/ExbB proton channel family protein [Myxococcota bacterium]
MVKGSSDSNLTLRALIISGLIAFGFYLLADLGLLRTGLVGDKSFISYLILAVYLGASLHWFWLVHALSRERRRLLALEVEAGRGGEWPDVEGGPLGILLANVRRQGKRDHSSLLEALGDDLANRHALGHFLSDVLLKLGLVGTVVGFILMLMPVGEMGVFDPDRMQELLGSMSAGMSVALYTTLAGLVTSTLLKAQYYLIDASLAEFVNRTTVLVNLHLGSDAS